MKLNDIYEAQYSGHERGSFHWILDKFFEGPNDDGEYWVDESRFIVQYKGKEIIGLQITTDWRGKDHIIMIPNAGGRASAFPSPLNRTGTAENLHVYSSKRLI